MSYDVFVVRYEQGTHVPWAWEPVRARLAERGLDEADVRDGEHIQLEDGGGAEVDIDESDAAFFFRGGGLTPAVADLMWDLALAGGAVVVAATDPLTVVLTDESQRGQVPDEIDGASIRMTTCSDPRGLYSALQLGFDEWTRWVESADWYRRDEAR